jgi:short-subunit dehydrogenase
MNWKQKLLLAYVTRKLTNKLKPHKESRLKQAAWLTAGGVGLVLASRALARRLNAYDLSGRNVLITGGSRGLGLVLAREFVGKGARVALCARDAEELERAAQELRQLGGVVLTQPCDLTDEAAVTEMVQAVCQQLGSVDVLVNNAGTISVGPLEEMRLEDFEEALDTNFRSALYTTLAVLPGMRSRRAGRIVNISSIGGKLSVPHLLPYSASKFALTGFSQGLRAELKQDGIVVTTICPGLMRTGSPRNATFKGQHEAEYAWFVAGDSLPLTSISAESAARRIIRACELGEAEVVLSLPAKLAAKFHGLFPGLTADMLAQANRLLPAPGGIGTARATGAESRSKLTPAWLTRLTDEAAVRNNQIH